MNTKMPKKITKTEAPVVNEIKNTVVVSGIGKLEPFGNEETHRLVAKVNEIIDKLNGRN